MTVEKLEFVFEERGVAQLGRNVINTAQSFTKLTETTSKAQLGLGQLGAGLTQAGSKLASLTGKGNETIGMLTDMASKAGTVVSAFASGGPWGAAIAGASIVLTGLVELLEKGSRASEEFANRLTGLTTQLDEIARRREAIETFGSSNLIARQRGRARERSFDVDDLNAAELESERKRKRQRQAEREASSRRGRGRSEAVERQPSLDDWASEQRELSELHSGVASRSLEGLMSGGTEDFDDMLSSLSALEDAMMKVADASIEMGKATETAGERASKGIKRAADSIVEDLGENATDALERNVDAWISGEKNIAQAAASMAKEILKSVVQQSIVKAVLETAEGVAAIARYDFGSAATHFSAAALYGSVAAVAGGVGLAVGAVGGGGAAAGGAAPAQPARPEATPDRERNQGPTVINLFAPNLLATSSEAHAGALMARAIRSAEKQFGTAA